MCKYCQPPNKYGFDDLGDNFLGDNDEVHLGINADGVLEIDIELETNIYDEYYEDYLKERRFYDVKFNYCPFCGRKL